MTSLPHHESSEPELFKKLQFFVNLLALQLMIIQFQLSISSFHALLIEFNQIDRALNSNKANTVSLQVTLPQLVEQKCKPVAA